MNKYGREKQAFFADGVIIATARTNHLKRIVKERRDIEGYKGKVWFRYCPEWENTIKERKR